MNYRAELNQLIIIANNTLKHKGSTHVIKLFDNHIIDDDFRISPTMSIKNLCNWLNGFISGLEF